MRSESSAQLPSRGSCRAGGDAGSRQKIPWSLPYRARLCALRPQLDGRDTISPDGSVMGHTGGPNDALVIRRG